jgi:hypothetical protein
MAGQRPTTRPTSTPTMASSAWASATAAQARAPPALCLELVGGWMKADNSQVKQGGVSCCSLVSVQ